MIINCCLYIYAFLLQINQMEMEIPFYDYLGLTGYIMDHMLYLSTPIGLSVAYNPENLFVNYPEMGIENEKFEIARRYNRNRYLFHQVDGLFIVNESIHPLTNFWNVYEWNNYL